MNEVGFASAAVLMYLSLYVLYVAWQAVSHAKRTNQRLMDEVADLRMRVWVLESRARKAEANNRGE